ncbi:hypothetical protein U2P91_03670 [Acetobacterium sp. K1/6]|jgi:hypothetical protein|nr:hypothetical protein [Acetobacterium sp. K1/6]MDK2961478.1 hypothetical protein [Eubacteriaceae bacterium]MDZ5724119.1 hypothetical protein [Acetobacterium sp. K1/6]
MVKGEFLSFLGGEKLNGKSPLGEIAGFNRFKHISTMIVLIGSGNFNGFIPNGGL